jgi:SprT protein
MKKRQADMLELAVERSNHFLRVFADMKPSLKIPSNVEIVLEDLGTNSGIAYGHKKIAFNVTLMSENLDEFLRQTVPHEVAHLCVKLNYEDARPHGKEWRDVMRSFGVEPKRLHTYDVSNVRLSKNRDMTKHLYTCKCNTQHFLSPQKAKVVKQLVCSKCNKKLIFVEQAKESVLKKKYSKTS